MNAYKLNGTVGHLARNAIVEGLNIEFSKIYSEVIKINPYTGIILTKQGTYKLTLTKLEDEKNN